MILKRGCDALSKYDVTIIGGGIVGAATSSLPIARHVVEIARQRFDGLAGRR